MRLIRNTDPALSRVRWRGGWEVWAETLLKDFPKIQARLSKYLKQTVLPGIQNQASRGKPFSAAGFLKSLRLQIVDLHATGKASFWFSPSEALNGHALILYGTATGEIDDFDTPG